MVSRNLSNCYIVISPSICVFFIVLVGMRLFKIRGECLLLSLFNERLWLQIFRKVPIDILIIIVLLIIILFFWRLLNLQSVVYRVEFSRDLIVLMRLNVYTITPGHSQFIRATIFFPLLSLTEVAAVGRSMQSLGSPIMLMLILRNWYFFEKAVWRYGLLIAIYISSTINFVLIIHFSLAFMVFFL